MREDFSQFSDPFDVFANLFGGVPTGMGPPGRGARGAHGGGGVGFETDMFGRTVFRGPGFNFAIGQPNLWGVAAQVSRSLPPQPTPRVAASPCRASGNGCWRRRVGFRFRTSG